MTSRLRRSCLAVPGSSPKLLAKAAGLDADQVFLDLEDAVAPELKNDDTRRLVIGALSDHSWLAPTRAIRINAVGTPWCLDDIVTIVQGAGRALSDEASRKLALSVAERGRAAGMPAGTT